METISSIDKKSQFQSIHLQIQPHYIQNQTQQPKQSLNYSTSILNHKTQFLKYASSLIQITTQDDIPNQLQIYEESQLINPPQSLILKYQNLKISHQNNHTALKPPKKSKENLIFQGTYILSQFFQRHSQKLSPKKTFNSSQTLINILALSSVQNFTQKDEKIALEQAFHKLKTSYQKSKLIQQNLRPLLPIDKKRNAFMGKIQTPKKIIRMDENKKHGIQQIAGSITFKILEIQSQSFKLLKMFAVKLAVLKFLVKMSSVCFSSAFKKIKNFEKHSNLSKYDSKILTLSRSKSKGSLSKLKISNLKSNSQKKITIKRLYSQQNTEYTTSGEQNFKQRIISSEILDDFDFTQLQSNVNEQQYANEAQKKMQFNNRLKKKSMKQSQSQAETLNSLRSLQSEEYQFCNDIKNLKVSSSVKPISIKSFNNVKNVDENEDMPTSGMIHYNVKKKKTSFQTNLYNTSLNQAKQISLFNMRERRYLNVRTNLFELPLQMNLESQSKKEYMQKIYHLMPQKLLRSDNAMEDKDNFLENLKIINISQHLSNKQRNYKVQKNLLQKFDTKNNIIQKIENNKSQNYYFQLRNAHSQKNIYIPIQNSQIDYLRKQKIVADNNLNLKIPKNVNSPKLDKQEGKKINKQQKLKNKLTKNNFEQYYFKAQIQKNKTSIKNKQVSNQEFKNQRVINKKHFQNDNGRVQGKNELYEAQYRASKILPQGNMKIIKSLSPKVKLSIHSPYRTGKLGNRVLNKNINNQTCSGRSENSSKMSMQKYSTIQPNFLPLQIQSSMNTPTNLHNFVPNIQQNIMNTHRSSSKLKVFSQTPRSLSPQQNNFVPHFFPTEKTQRKVSFITNGISNTCIQQHMNRIPSNTVHFTQQISSLVPTISNISNQSKFINSTPNVHRVINYGPSVGYNQQFTNRPSSILSTHSNQNRQKIIIGKPSQVMMSPTQRIMHGIEKNTIPQKKLTSPIKNVQGFQSQLNSNQKRGLNVMVRNTPSIQPQNPSNQQNSLRQKSISHQKIFITTRR